MDRNLNNNEIIDCVQYEQPFDPRALYSPVAYFYTAGNEHSTKDHEGIEWQEGINRHRIVTQEVSFDATYFQKNTSFQINYQGLGKPMEGSNAKLVDEVQNGALDSAIRSTGPTSPSSPTQTTHEMERENFDDVLNSRSEEDEEDYEEETTPMTNEEFNDIILLVDQENDSQTKISRDSKAIKKYKNEPNVNSNIKKKLRNFGALCGQRVRTGILHEFRRTKKRNMNDRLFYLAERFREEQLNQEEVEEFLELIEAMGVESRTISAVGGKFQACKEKYKQIFGRCVVAFLSEEGQEDYARHLNKNKGKDVKKFMQENPNYKSKFVAEYKELFDI